MNKNIYPVSDIISLRENVSLKGLNSFQVAASTRYFAEVYNISQLKALVKEPVFHDEKRLILGGGSNILFKGDFEGLVVRVAIPGIERVKEDESHVWVKAGAGVIWHEFVMHCLNHNYSGLENLSLIPGSVGAAPIQNIGAYGVEQDQLFDRLEAVDIRTGELYVFDRQDCGFAYRDSVFKQALRDTYVISSVTYKLNKQPELNLSYGAITQTLAEMEVQEPTIRQVSEAVCTIRRSKLPDPAELGNSGSFFKNPIVGLKTFQSLKLRYPDLPSYVLDSDEVKIPAGWLIEQSGWKGKTSGNVGTHKKQALVIVNYGGATGEEIYRFAMLVKQAVLDEFGVTLVPEVNVV